MHVKVLLLKGLITWTESTVFVNQDFMVQDVQVRNLRIKPLKTFISLVTKDDRDSVRCTSQQWIQFFDSFKAILF